MAQMLIAGAPVPSVSDQWYEVRNPATQEAVGQVPLGTPEDVRAAVDAAEDTFKRWSERRPAERARILARAARVVEAHAESLAPLLTREQGKPLGEARSELRSFVNTFRYYASLAKELGPSSKRPTSTGDAIWQLLKQPLGVCGAILPWNFPVSLMAWKLAPGTLAGNTFVIKPARTTPLTELALAELLIKAGYPGGAVNFVTGHGEIVGEAMLANSKIRKIAFTGETRTGRRIMAGVAGSLKRLTLELGGSDPAIVCEDADLDLAVEGVTWGRFRNCGQSCTAIKRVFVFRRVANQFVRRLREKVRTIRVGNGLAASTDMGPLHSESQLRAVQGMISDARARGAKIQTGGERLPGADHERGWFLVPTVLTEVDPAAQMSCEECFGPALPVFVVADLDEAIQRANDTIYGLGASVWTRSKQRATKAADALQAGAVWVNEPPIQYPECEFGGVKQSGLGRELGVHGLYEYVDIKTVRIDILGRRKKWRFPI